MNTEIVVFLGPSLPLIEAKQILPTACYHDPVRCGDILKLLRLPSPPKILAIIDGYFERTAAVWHKEILFALSRGIQVYGASSMGALRAAELADFGMVGFGEIYRSYQNNEIIDDDEVALVHDERYQPTSTPMINIRFTIEKAIERNVISHTEGQSLLIKIKSTPYQNRNLLAQCQGYPAFQAWLEDNYIDQKHLDAKALLKHLATKPTTKTNKHPVFNSLFFTKIVREMAVTPFSKSYDWLPESEKYLCSIANGKDFYWLQCAAKLLHIHYDICRARHIQLEANDLGQNILEYAQNQQSHDTIPDDVLLKYLLIYRGEYEAFKDSHGEASLANYRYAYPKHYQTIQILITLLRALIYFCHNQNFNINNARGQKFADSFFQENRLFELPDIINWLQQNDLIDEAGLSDWVEKISILHFIVEQNNIVLTGINTSLEPYPWLVEAFNMIKATKPKKHIFAK